MQAIIHIQKYEQRIGSDGYLKGVGRGGGEGGVKGHK